MSAVQRILFARVESPIRIGRFKTFCIGYGRIISSLPMNFVVKVFARPRAGNPENARVLTVVSVRDCLGHVLEQLADDKTRLCLVIRKLSLNRSSIFD